MQGFQGAGGGGSGTPKMFCNYKVSSLYVCIYIVYLIELDIY